MPAIANINHSTNLIRAIYALDAELTGLGLYSCCEKVGSHKAQTFGMIEWQLGIHPYLEKAGYTAERRAKLEDYAGVRCTYVRYMAPDATICDLRIIRFSKIKVRVFGDGYQVDRSANLDDQWDSRALAGFLRKSQDRISCQCKPHVAAPDINLVLFLGFEASRRPFHRDLAELEKITQQNEDGNEFKSKSWADPYRRKFYNIAACWTFANRK